MRFDVITLLPEAIISYCGSSIIGRAQREGLIEVHCHNLRNFGLGKHRKVDDSPYGGGTGMVIMPEPVFAAHRSIPHSETATTILLTPRGRLLTQKVVREELSKNPHLIIVCGRYEGFDDRITALSQLQISLGNYILTGGEIGAMAIIDSVSRLVPGVLPKGEAVLKADSFADEEASILEAPQFTRPANFEGLCVPDVLLSGDHSAIAQWRIEHSPTEG